MARATKYKKEYDDKAYKLSLLGSTDKEIAGILEVTVSTLNLWKKNHKTFSESLKKGKDDADANVTKSLYQRAMGYSHKEEHATAVKGKIVIKIVEKFYPPDPTSMIFWLKNRQPRKWRDVQTHKFDFVVDDKKKAKAKAALKEAQIP